MPRQANVDFVTGGGSSGGLVADGSVAMRLLESDFNVRGLRTLDTLRKDEWLLFDNVVIEIARERLVGIADLKAAGLTMNLPNALGTTIVEWEDISDMDPAEISMSAVTMGQNDRVVYTLNSLPIPIVHKDFNINIRALSASRTRGMPLDTTQAELCAKLIAEQNETILFDGATITVGGAVVYGYTNAPNRNTGSITDWELVGTTGTTILDEILAMIDALQGDHMYGPYILYVPLDYHTKMLADFKTNSDKTILQRILELPMITTVKPAEKLTGGGSGEVLLIQMTRDVVDLVEGMDPTTVQWDTHGGMVTNFKIMSILVPRIKNDQSLQSGIAHYTV